MQAVRRLVAAGGVMVLAGVGLLPSPAPAADPQVLASSCSGCHTNDGKLTTAIPRIRGLPEPVILQAMQGFRAGQRQATVMDRIAKGFTDEEIKQLAAYISAQR